MRAICVMRWTMESSSRVQPQFLAAGELVGFEALLRWDHPERGTISPYKFIPIAEETGLVVAIGQWVLLQACRQLAAWRSAGYHKLRMAVNVSTLQFERQDWVETIAAALKATGVPPRPWNWNSQRQW